MKPAAWSWRIVLVRPRNPLNIGAAARAMANFGFRDLIVVAPFEPVWQETRSAVGAEDIIAQARAVKSLDEALADCLLVAGTTSGARRNLDRELIPLNQFPQWLTQRRPGDRKGRPAPPERRAVQRTASAGLAALLFGSEKTGLSKAALSHCHALVRIPTLPDCPSMNLGQAVAVCCYELARGRAVASRLPSARVHLSDPASHRSLEHLFNRAARLLDLVGYLKPKSRETTLIKLRRVLLDLGLTNSHARILGSILAQIDWSIGGSR